MSSERNPSRAEVIRRAVDAWAARLRKCIPCVVTRWDASTQKAELQPLVRAPFFDEEGERQTERHAVITGVPVQFPGAGPFRITFPISDGTLVIDGQTIKATTGTAFFGDRSLDKWLTGTGGEVDPEFDHTHADMDAIFFPGLHPFGAPLGSCPTDHATMGADAGVQIHYRGAVITVGDEAGSDFLAAAGKTNGNFNALKSHFAALEAIIGGPPILEPGNGAPSAFQAALALALTTPPNAYPNPQDVATTQAKGK